MRKLYFSLLAGAFAVLTIPAYAQTTSNDDGFSQLIKSTPADASKLVNAYAQPLFKGFGVGLNSGWNNTAKTKGLLHFELRLTFNAAIVPASDKSFDVRSLGLSNHVTVDPASSTSIAPTFSGSGSAATPLMDINNDSGQKISSFNMPQGQVSAIPAPNIQLTIGLVRNTDITIRTIPTIKLSDDIGSVGMIGFGVKHNIIQDFAKKIPKPFDLALAVNYNRITYKKTLDVRPDASSASGQSQNYGNQRIEGHFSGVNVQAIFSKKLLLFTPFVSVAYQTAKTNLGVLGNFPVTTSANINGTTNYSIIADPVHINSTSISGMRGDVGFQLNLAVFRIYAAVSSGGGYVSGNGGIGFGF